MHPSTKRQAGTFRLSKYYIGLRYKAFFSAQMIVEVYPGQSKEKIISRMSRAVLSLTPAHCAPLLAAPDQFYVADGCENGQDVAD
jgi:hypothetical protein